MSQTVKDIHEDTELSAGACTELTPGGDRGVTKELDETKPLMDQVLLQSQVLIRNQGYL